MLFAPGFSPLSPAITNVALGSSVSTTTLTSVVYGSISMESRPRTSLSFTVKVASSTLFPKATFKVTVYVEVVSPSAAVTVTTNSFTPATRSTPPSTLKVASGSVGSTTIATSAV